MLMSISSQRIDQINSINRNATIANVTSQANLISQGGFSSTPATSEFIAYVIINEATMLDVRYRNAMLNFKLTAGKLKEQW